MDLPVSMLQLYQFPFSGNCYRVRLVASVLGIDYQATTVDIFALRRTGWPAELLALNPRRKVPFLVDGGAVIAESHAIAVYLARGTSWWPRGTMLQARILEWMLFTATRIDLVEGAATLGRLRAIRSTWPRFAPDRRHELTRDELAALEVRCEAGAASALTELDQQIAVAPFLLGDPTLADLACIPYIHAAFAEAVLDLAPYRHVVAWLDRVQALPGFIPLEPS